MGRFTRVSADAFDSLQIDAGVLLTNFDPANPTVPQDTDILCTTTGGVKIDCKPTFSDFGADVDNVPNNTMEMKHIDGWDCTAAFSSIKFNGDNFKVALGAADMTTNGGVKKVTPRRDLKQTDFSTVWWVGDKTNGGAVAVKLFNMLSTEGMSIQTTKNNKGTIAMTLTGHVSLNAQDVVPMEFYELPAPTP